MRIATNGTELEVTLTGAGRPLVLLHGWPHTRHVWQRTIALLAGRSVIAPDLRGLGDSAPVDEGFDAGTGAADILGLLDALGLEQAEVAAIDAAVPAAFLLAMRHPDRVRRLVLMEGTLPGLPGGFAVAPWWFGFHAVPDLAEVVVAGREAAYLGWFLASMDDDDLRDGFVQAYTGRDRLRRGFGCYRAMARNEQLVRDAVADATLRVPTVAVGGNVVGDRLRRQLEPITDDLRGELLERCGHIVPLDRPDALAELLQCAEPD